MWFATQYQKNLTISDNEDYSAVSLIIVIFYNIYESEYLTLLYDNFTIIVTKEMYFNLQKKNILANNEVYIL